MKVLVGSKNPVKIQGAKEALLHYFEQFEIEGIDVSSDVGEEPVNDEIYQGAMNRVNNLMKRAKEKGIETDLFLGIESGITNQLGKWMIISIAVIKDRDGYESWGSSPGFPVPDKLIKEIQTSDLGQVMDQLFEQHDLRSSKGGIWFLTKHVIDRIDLTREAFIMALTQHLNTIWSDKTL